MILETRYSVLCFNLHGIFYPLFILKSKAFHKVHLDYQLLKMFPMSSISKTSEQSLNFIYRKRPKIGYLKQY